MASDAQVSIVLKLIDKASRQLNTISKSSQTLGKNFQSLGSKMTRNVTLPLLAVGAASIKVATDFDASMRNIQAFGGQTEEQLKSLGQQFKEMSVDMSKTTDTANGLSKAYFNIQSAGFLAEEGMEVLRVSTKAATAGLTDTATASEGVMSILNAYGLVAKDAASVSDSLFTTIKFGVGTFEQLIPVLGDVIPIASSMNIAFDEVNASLATMSKAGVNFNKGATQIKATMTALLSPSDALLGTIQQLGFASGQAIIDAKGFGGALEAIADSVNNDTTALANLFPNVRALNGVLNLTGANAAVFNEILGEMGDKAGATQEAFEKQMKSFSAQFKNFRNVLQVAAIDIGNILLPVLLPIVKALGDMVKAFTALPEPIRGVIVSFGLLLFAIGPILKITGLLLTNFGALKTGFLAFAQFIPPLATALVSILAPALSGAATAFAAFWAAVTGPVGLAALAIAGIILAVAKFNPAIGAVINQLGVLLREGLQQVANIMGQIVEIIFKAISRAGEAFFKLGAIFVISIAKGIFSGAKAAIQAISDVGNSIISAVEGVFGIASPSKIMMEIGANVGLGFNKGVDQSMGGINAPITPTLAVAGGGGNINISIHTINAPGMEAVVETAIEKIGTELKKQGVTGGGIVVR